MVARPRQFKLLLSDQEWQRLGMIASAYDIPMSDVLRSMIHERYDEVMAPPGESLYDLAGRLTDVARKLRKLSPKR